MRIAIFAALLIAASPAFAQLHGNVSIGAESFGAGTLAPLGSFEFEAAPAYSQLAMARHRAAVALGHGAITIDQAEAVQSRADVVRALLDQSISACAPNARGHCTKSLTKARRLLAEATIKLAAINEEPKP